MRFPALLFSSKVAPNKPPTQRATDKHITWCRKRVLGFPFGQFEYHQLDLRCSTGLSVSVIKTRPFLRSTTFYWMRFAMCLSPFNVWIRFLFLMLTAESPPTKVHSRPQTRSNTVATAEKQRGSVAFLRVPFAEPSNTIKNHPSF